MSKWDVVIRRFAHQRARSSGVAFAGKSSLRFQISSCLDRQQGSSNQHHVPSLLPRYLLPNEIHLSQLLLPCGHIFRGRILSMPLNHAGLTPVALNKNPISKLSADHFSIIVKFLELVDIQSARLASRGLHFFLSPYLIKSVRFAAQGDQLALLAKISQNGVFRRSVRTLRYDVNLHELPVSTWNELDAAG
jgi:hypothetical protein